MSCKCGSFVGICRHTTEKCVTIFVPLLANVARFTAKEMIGDQAEI